MSDPTRPAEASDDELLAALARRVVRYRMEVPALLFLESVRPLSFVGAQAMIFFAPLVQAIFPLPQYERLALLLEDRANLDRLARRIEVEAEGRERDPRPEGDADREKEDPASR